MWDLTYKTKDEYLGALEKAAAEKEVKDASNMVSDFKKFFDRRGKEFEGDLEVISRLPLPETLADQYAGCTWGKRRAVRKEGRAGFFKRFGVSLISAVLHLLYFLFYVVLGIGAVAGIGAVLVVACYQLKWVESVPAEVLNLYGMLPANILHGLDRVPWQHMLQSWSGAIFLIATGVFAFFLFGTILKGMRRLMKRYRNWSLSVISGRFRLPVSMDYIYSTPWRVLTYVLLPISMVAAIASGFLLWLGY